MKARTCLVLGGARSGKSRYAEGLAEGWAGPRIYVATAEAGDEEMRARIVEHRLRRGAEWTTVEAPLDLEAALSRGRAPDVFILVDCVTLWISNLLLAGRDVGGAAESLCGRLNEHRGRMVLVSNEVGLGIVPENALARRFRDAAGWTNQRLAAAVDEVVLMTAGLPLKLKQPDL